MKKTDKILYAAASFCVVAFAVISVFLPDQVLMGVSSGSLKSKYFLLLLSALPFVSVFLFTVNNLSRKVSALLAVAIELYCLILTLQAFGFSVNLPFIVFLAIGAGCVYLALSARKGRLKVFQQWSQSEERNKKLGFLLFLSLAFVFFVFSFISLLTSISPGFVIIPVMIVLIIFMILEIVSLKKEA